MEVSEEYIPPTYRTHIQQRERMLYLAVIQEALRDLNKKSQYNDAYRWLTDLNANGPTSLNGCCAVVGYRPELIAQAVRNGVRIDKTALWNSGLWTKVCCDPLVAGKNW